MKSANQSDKPEHATPGHVTKGDIFDDLGFSPDETLEARIKADIWQALIKHIEHEGLNQAQLAALLKCHQPDVSNLLRGRISRFSITKLIQFAGRLNLDASVKVRASNAAKSGLSLKASTRRLTRGKRELAST